MKPDKPIRGGYRTDAWSAFEKFGGFVFVNFYCITHIL